VEIHLIRGVRLYCSRGQERGAARKMWWRVHGRNLAQSRRQHNRRALMHFDAWLAGLTRANKAPQWNTSIADSRHRGLATLSAAIMVKSARSSRARLEP